AAVTFTVNPAGLKSGTYSAYPTIRTPSYTLAGGQFLVLLKIGSQLETSSIQTFQLGAGAAPASQNIQVTSNVPGVSFTVKPTDVPWITMSPLSGVTPGSLKITVNPAGLSAGRHYSSYVHLGYGS